MLLSIKEQYNHGGKTWKRYKWCNKQWVWSVCTSSNSRAKERAGFHKEKEIPSDDAKHAKVSGTFFFQSLLKGNVWHDQHKRPARENKEVRQCLNKSDIFQLTSPKSLLPYWGKQLKPPQCHQHRSQSWGGMCFCTLGKANLASTTKGWARWGRWWRESGGVKNQRPFKFLEKYWKW